MAGKIRNQIKFLAAAVFLCLSIGSTALAAEDYEEPPTSGKCGADITWKYEPIMVGGNEEASLVLTGSGPMTNEYLKRIDYEEGGTWHYEAMPPWNGKSLYGIKLDDRITTIGDGAFGLVDLYDPNKGLWPGEEEGTLVLPQNVTSIGKLAFWNATFGSIYIGPNVKSVGEEAFFSCQMKDLFVASMTLDFGKEERVLALSTLETIHAPKGSKAESYAKAHNIKYEEWDGTDYGKTSYTVTLDAGEGAFPETAQLLRYTVSADRKTAAVMVGISAGSVPVPDIAPVLAGKYFGGWYLGEEPFSFETTALTEDVTLTAKWLDAPPAPVLTIKNDEAKSITLSWELRMDANLKGYRIYWADTAESSFTKITEEDWPADRISYGIDLSNTDVVKKKAYRYRIEAVYEIDGAEKTVSSNEVSCNGMITNADLIRRTDGLYVAAKIVKRDGTEVSSLTLHEGETSGEMYLALVKKDGSTVLWEDALNDFQGSASAEWGLGLPYPVGFPASYVSEEMAPYEYAKFPIGYLFDAACTRLKGLKITTGKQLYLYVDGQPGFMTAIPVTVEAAEPDVTYPSYDDHEGIVTDDLQAGLQILRDAVRDRVNYGEVFIKKSACDPSIEAYNALHKQDESDNPSGDWRGGLIPDWFEAELYDINKNRPGMDPWEGDYAYYAIQQSQSYADLENPVTIYGEEYYKLTLDIPRFTTTAEQEAAVDAKVLQLLNGRLAGVKGQSKYVKAKAIYDYVSTSMSYSNSDPVYHYAYGGLCKGKATCMGFALSFQRLASELGLESKVIMGLDGGAHTYNIVKMEDGKYYYLDCSAKVFLKGKSFRHAQLQDRYLSTAFQTYYMANIAENDYKPGEASALRQIRALTDEEIKNSPEYNGAFPGIADRTMAKYTIRGNVIQATPFDNKHPLKPVYLASADQEYYLLAFRLTVDPDKFDENGRIHIYQGEYGSKAYTKENSTLAEGYLDLLCPIELGEVSIAVDYDTAEEGASRYEASTYTMDLSKLVKAAVRSSGTVKERTDALSETGIEISSPTISYRNDDKEVTATYEAVAYSAAIDTANTGIAETAGNYAALRISAPEAMLGTAALAETTAAFVQASGDEDASDASVGLGMHMKWGAEKTYLDCYCKMEAGKEKTLTVKWAGKETRTQTVTLRPSQDCYLEPDGADKDVAKRVAFNGIASMLYVGQSQIADVKVTKAYEKDEVQLSFTSDDSNVLSVNRVTGEMKALRPGKATLTVRAAGLDARGKAVSASKAITVKAVPAPAGIKITDVKDVSGAATWKINGNSQWTEGYAVPYTDALGSNAKAWKAAVEAALTGAGLDNGMAADMTDAQRQALETALSEALCPGASGKVVTAKAQTADGRLDWASGLRPNTAYVFYVRNMTENAAGEISYAGWMSGKITTKKPVLTTIQLKAYHADGTEAAFNDQAGSGYSYTDPTNEMLPAEVKYALTAANTWENDRDVYKSPSYKSTNPKVVKVNNKGSLSLGGQAGTAEIYVTGKDSCGTVRESNRISIRVVRSVDQLQNKTTTLMLGQPVSVRNLVGCKTVKGEVSAFQMDGVDFAAMVAALQKEDCFVVTYPDGAAQKAEDAVITPVTYPINAKGERRKGNSLTIPVNLYRGTGDGRELVDTKNAVVKVNDMPAPAVSKVTTLDTSADITIKPNAVVREIDGAQYYYTLTLTNRSTGAAKTYLAGKDSNNPLQPDVVENTFTYQPLYDKKGQLTSWLCTIDGLTAYTAYEAVATAYYQPPAQNPQDTPKAPVQKASGKKNFTTLKQVIAAENSMKVSLVSMEALWADANAAGQEIAHDAAVELKNGQTYVLFADIGDYDRITGTDRIKWSVTSDPRGAAAIKASSDSYTANLTLSRCGTVRVQAVSTLSKKVVCSFTVEVKPYQSGSSAQAGGNQNED